jgi:dephospho-CoA kinase
VLVIGLTGGIGTGKTEVTQVLLELGAVVIESDKVAHSSYLPGTKAHEAIVSQFGNDVLDPSGFIDRKSLGKIVFSDPARRLELEEVVWPVVEEMIEARLAEEEKRGTKVVVFEVAKLYEPGWDRLADIVWTVESPRGDIGKRVEQRSGLDESETGARLAAQLTSDERKSIADLVIENNTTLDDLRDQIVELWESISEKRNR